MTRESTLLFAEKGVKVAGIDAWSRDRPFPSVAREFREQGDPWLVWETHFAGMGMGCCHMERWPAFRP